MIKVRAVYICVKCGVLKPSSANAFLPQSTDCDLIPTSPSNNNWKPVTIQLRRTTRRHLHIPTISYLEGPSLLSSLRFNITLTFFGTMKAAKITILCTKASNPGNRLRHGPTRRFPRESHHDLVERQSDQ